MVGVVIPHGFGGLLDDDALPEILNDFWPLLHNFIKDSNVDFFYFQGRLHIDAEQLLVETNTSLFLDLHATHNWDQGSHLFMTKIVFNRILVSHIARVLMVLYQ
jgi:hypothetical protein